tara:strand:- start:52263 stop:52838 length:576 start_codon:yes stop_codon:yes gene_type:complete
MFRKRRLNASKMRKIITILVVLFFSEKMASQEMFSVDVFADPKLAIMTDDYGNKPFTPNLLVNFSVQSKQLESGYYFFGQALEYADLHGGKYFRYSVLQVGYTFNRIPILSERIETSIAFNYGIVKRWSFDFANIGATMDLSYCVSDKIKFTSLLQFVRRTDIESPNDSIAIYRTSVFLGFRVNLSGINVI